MSNVLLLTNGREPSAEILPSLGLLGHAVRIAPAAAEQATTTPVPDAILVDARRDLVHARRVLIALRSSANSIPVIAIVTDGGWAAVSADWGADDLLLHTAGPAEVEARLRLAIGRRTQSDAQQLNEIRSGGLVVNEATYSARMHGRSLDLTFKEFELLKFLAQHPGRVFTRAQLLQEVWGYDYFGGTRTVDVHVRRLRAKLGAENEALIGTVRNVGYRFVPVKGAANPDNAALDGADIGRRPTQTEARPSCDSMSVPRSPSPSQREHSQPEHSRRGPMPAPSPAGDEIQVSGPLPPDQAGPVLDLVRRAAEEDGVNPLSEHVMLHLRYGAEPGARNLVLWHDGALAGYAHLEPADPVEGTAGEMVIDPAMRRHGLGLTLTRALAAEAGDSDLRLWAHGELPAAGRLAAAAELHQVPRPVADAQVIADRDRQSPDRRRNHRAHFQGGPGRGCLGQPEPPGFLAAP